MHTAIVLLASLAALASGCKGIDCGDGTTERNGTCVASSETVGTAKCGPFTELHGDMCVPMFPPTTCDPTTTQPDTDVSTGVTTCIGTGAAGCSAKLPCPVSTTGKQTICGQLYDFENGQPFAQAGATGAQCEAGAVAGPCALAIKAYDAVTFAGSNGAAGQLATGAVYIDDCGRFKVPEVTQPTMAPLIALGVDDIAAPGPTGISNAVGVATGAAPNTATKDVEAFIVRPVTTAGWSGPSLATGIFAMVFRGHATGTDLAAGVTASRNGASDMGHDYYFGASATSRTTLDGAANVTGVNGTALFTITAPQLTDTYAGTGALPASCIWGPHAGAAVQGVVFIQIFRPANAPGMTCPL
jgi:hypothetical protein